LISLSVPADTNAESAWDDELDRRMQGIESGAEVGRPAEDVLAEIRARYS